jgi:YgiT-type zinc finger domain-containing protein
MTNENKAACPLCGGAKEDGKTTFTADLGFGVVVIRDVPATICSQCGADWLSDSVSAQIEQMVQEARKKRHQVEVTLWNSVA